MTQQRPGRRYTVEFPYSLASAIDQEAATRSGLAQKTTASDIIRTAVLMFLSGTGGRKISHSGQNSTAQSVPQEGAKA